MADPESLILQCIREYWPVLIAVELFLDRVVPRFALISYLCRRLDLIPHFDTCFFDPRPYLRHGVPETDLNLSVTNKRRLWLFGQSATRVHGQMTSYEVTDRGERGNKIDGPFSLLWASNNEHHVDLNVGQPDELQLFIRRQSGELGIPVKGTFSQPPLRRVFVEVKLGCAEYHRGLKPYGKVMELPRDIPTPDALEEMLSSVNCNVASYC